MYLLWKIVWVLLLCYIGLNMYLYYHRRKYRHFNSIPVPITFYWFLGVLPDLKRRRRLKPTMPGAGAFLQYHEEFGWDVFVASLVHRQLLFCMDLKMVPKILTDRVTFPKDSGFHKTMSQVAGVRIFGEYGLLSDTGTDMWLAKRKTMDPAFHKSFLKTVMYGMNKVSASLVDKLDSKIGTGPFDITDDLARSALEAISICGFNWDDELLENYGDMAVRMGSVIVNTVSLLFQESYTFNLPWNRRAEKKNVQDCVPLMRNIMKKHLQERIKEGDHVKDDILSYIIRSNQCSDVLTIEDLVDEYLTFLGAGMETTALAMSVTIFYLTTNQEIYKRAQEEVDEVFQDKTELSFDDISKLVYLDMVIKECLRIRPPVRGTGRTCKRDNVEVDGILIPKSTDIFIPTIALHHDPRHWKNPEQFNPERFDPKAASSIKPFTYMPFMAGPRSCIGKNFAVLEMKLVLSRILREFELINPNPGVKDIETTGSVTARPLHGVRISVCHRGEN